MAEEVKLLDIRASTSRHRRSYGRGDVFVKNAREKRIENAAGNYMTREQILNSAFIASIREDVAKREREASEDPRVALLRLRLPSIKNGAVCVLKLNHVPLNILMLLERGLSNSRIAEKLGMNETDVHHEVVHTIYVTLGLAKFQESLKRVALQMIWRKFVKDWTDA